MNHQSLYNTTPRNIIIVVNKPMVLKELINSFKSMNISLTLVDKLIKDLLYRAVEDIVFLIENNCGDYDGCYIECREYSSNALFFSVFSYHLLDTHEPYQFSTTEEIYYNLYLELLDKLLSLYREKQLPFWMASCTFKTTTEMSLLIELDFGH